MRATFYLLLLTVFFSSLADAAVIRTTLSRQLDLSSEMVKYNQYDLILGVDIKPIQAFSIIAISKPIEFQLKCSESIVGQSVLFFDDAMENKTFKREFVAKDVRTKCPNGMFTLAIYPNGVELEANLEKATYELQNLGEDAEGFIQRYNSEHDSNVADLIYFHSQMSESIANRDSFHCLIKGYETDILKEEIVQDLIKEYKKIFGVEYVAADINCQKPVSLAVEIASCTTNPRTRFCGNYRLYLESLAWLKEARSKAAFFKSQIPASLKELNDQLQVIVEQIETDLKTSVAQTGAT
jgi:hypothetical protein